MNFREAQGEQRNILRLKAVSQINVQLDKQVVQMASSWSSTLYTHTHIGRRLPLTHTRSANNLRHSPKVGNEKRNDALSPFIIAHAFACVCFSFYSISQLVASACVCVCASCCSCCCCHGLIAVLGQVTWAAQEHAH